MSSSHHPAKGRFTLLALLIAAAIAFAQWKGWLPADGGGIRPAGPGPAPGSGSIRKIGAWEELRGCTLVEDRGNDGDSFVVRHQGKDHTLRLYFADCPEKYRHQYNGGRIAEQGRYFDGLTGEETVGVGEDARDFTLSVLRPRPFTVLTRWEPVFDSQRFYAFVTLAQGEDLAELLVARGLARIHTKGENRPGGAAASTEKQRLQSVERKAKAANVGAWAIR
jgi:endonuclease YncB( thermonuclease family)